MHGHAVGGYVTPTYRSWVGMLQRVTNPRNDNAHRYSARGITVCERWRDFKNFLADMGERPPGLTLDRIDNDGNYEPGNCRWATQSIQNRNYSKTKLTLSAAIEIVRRRRAGERPTDLAKEFGISRPNVHHIATGQKWPDALSAVEQEESAA